MLSYRATVPLAWHGMVVHDIMIGVSRKGCVTA